MRISQILLVIVFFFFVNPRPLAQCDFDVVIGIEPEIPDNIYCPEDVVILSAGQFDSYQWYYNFSNSNTGGTPVAGGNVPTLAIIAGEWAVVYFYVEATLDGCTEASATVVWDSWVFAGVGISHVSQSEYCEGDSVLIENAFQGPTNFQWYRNGEEIFGATESKYWVTESGTYTLSASWPMCPAYFISSGVGPTYTFFKTTPPEITADGSVLAASYGNSFQWYLEGVEIPGAMNATFEPTVQGNYTVEIVDDNGCKVFSDSFLFLISSAETIQFDEAYFEVYPNPVLNNFSIANSSNLPFDIEIANMNGKVLYSGKKISRSSIEIHSERWVSGIYVCRIMLNNEFFQLRLIKI